MSRYELIDDDYEAAREVLLARGLAEDERNIAELATSHAEMGSYIFRLLFGLRPAAGEHERIFYRKYHEQITTEEAAALRAQFAKQPLDEEIVRAVENAMDERIVFYSDSLGPPMN